MKLYSVIAVLLLAACGATPDQTSDISGNKIRGRMQSGMFPLGPDSRATPGELCDHPTSYRYAERIKYCERNVDSSLKAEVIRDYDSEFGYRIESMNRMQFKIDHYIPLCMGGSNNQENLWPQHESVYSVTDPLEGELCMAMSEGRMLQVEAVILIKKAKATLSEVQSIRAQVARH